MPPNNQLVHASRTGQLEKVSALLSGDQIDVNYLNRDSNTACIYASRHGYPEIVRQLLNRKANPNIQGEQQNTALIWASRNVRPEVVQLLLESCASPNLCGENNWTASRWTEKVRCRKCALCTPRMRDMLLQCSRKELRLAFAGVLSTDVLNIVCSFLL